MPEYFNPNLIPQSLDAVYNAYMAQQDRDRRGKMEALEYGKPLSEIGEADIQAHIARKREMQQMEMQKGMADTEFTRSRTALNNALAAQGGKAPSGYRFTATGDLEKIPGGPVDAKKPDMEAAMNLYETAREGLIGGLSGSATGPVVGRLPAFTANQQIAEGGVAAMAPVLKQLFRVAGEGVFTDRDQQLLLDMIPTRKTRPEAWKPQIENIDRIVKAKLGMGKSSGMASMGQPQAQANDPRALIKQLAAQGMSRDQIKAELQKRGL